MTHAKRGFASRVLLWCAVSALLVGGATPVFTQHHAVATLRAGEELVYRLRVPGFGTVGRGTMSVERTEGIRGKDAYLLRFDLRGRVGFAVVEDRTRSWIDPVALGTLRVEKTERSPHN
jgi:hypothetical protein